MNCVLIGYRGVGKSEVSRCLAALLGLQAASADDEIVRLAGKSIPEIVQSHGWPHFRDLESRVIADLASKDGLIIDTGGGAILREDNVSVLRRNGRLFWLKAQAQEIARRIGESKDRPALIAGKTFLEEIGEVLNERTPKYQAAADHEIDTSDKTPQKVAEEIAALFRAAHGDPIS